MKKRNKEEKRLQAKLEEILYEKEKAFALTEDLKLKLASEKDEAWIELVLMRKLGLVPEGQTKVHFVTKPKDGSGS